MLALRADLRASLADLVSVDAEQVALTGSTTDGCNVVLAGLDLVPDDEVITTTDEHFGLLGPLHASGRTIVVSRPDPDEILAAITPRTRLLALSHVLWTTGQVLPVHELRERSGLPDPGRCRAVGGRDPGGRARARLPHDLRAEVAVRARSRRAPSSSPTPRRLRVARPSYFAQKRYSPDGSFEPWPGARRFDPNWVPLASLRGLLTAVATRPDWGFERALALAERCRVLAA